MALPPTEEKEEGSSLTKERSTSTCRLRSLKIIDSPGVVRFWHGTGVLDRLTPESFEYEGAAIMPYLQNIISRSPDSSVRLSCRLHDRPEIDAFIDTINMKPQSLTKIGFELLDYAIYPQRQQFPEMDELYDALRLALKANVSLTTIKYASRSPPSSYWGRQRPGFTIDQLKELQYMVASNRVQLRHMSERAPLKIVDSVLLGGCAQFQHRGHHESCGFSCKIPVVDNDERISATNLSVLYESLRRGAVLVLLGASGHCL